MKLAELGAQLREERVSLSLTVEDLALRLKIPARILRSIEEGGVGDLPHTVYTRGFIKAYGGELGYSNERITELVDSLEDFHEDFSPPKTLEVKTSLDGRSAGNRRAGSLMVKLLVLALLGAGGYAYYIHTFRDGGVTPQTVTSAASSSSSSATSADQTSGNTANAGAVASADARLSAPASSLPDEPNASSGALVAGGPADVSPVGPDAASAGGEEAGGAPSGQSEVLPGTQSEADSGENTGGQASEADPVRTTGFAPLGETETAPEEATAGGAARQASLPAGMHQIVVTADADCWLHANADKTDTRQFTLKAGETFAMPFKTSMVLKLGNAGGVRISYDGREAVRPGAAGQVRTVTFPPESE